MGTSLYRRISTILIGFLCVLFAYPAVAQHEHPAGNPEKLGKVSFPVSCDAALQQQVSEIVAAQVLPDTPPV